MPQSVTATATCMCTFGMAPSTLNVLPIARTTIGGKPAATIADSLPIVNVPPFGMCTTPSNPTVAAATAAALGVLTPMPCIPNPAGQWLPLAPRTTIGGKPALVSGSMLVCAYGGQISITFPGQAQTSVNS